MWYAFLNRMGPINRQWMEENGYDWAGGRIDFDCNNENDPMYDRYGREVSVPMMHEEDWYSFGEWLGEQKWREYPVESVFDQYTESGGTIRWLRAQS